MKIVAKPIQVVAWFEENGTPHPVKFKLSAEDEQFKVIKVDRVLFKEKEKLAGNSMIIFRCQSVIDEVERAYEIKYELGTCKWILYKI